jgi:hypothetical protein
LDDQQLKIRYLRVNFVGLAMIGSVFIYALVVEVLKRNLAPFTGFGGLTPAGAQMLKYLLVALAFANVFIIKVIQKVLGAGSAEKLVMATVVTFVLCEAVSLFGLALFLLDGNAMDFYTFMFLSLFYFWLFFPKYQDWEDQLGTPGAKNA